MEIEDDLDISSRQDILNTLQLHILAPFFIDIVMHLIEDVSDSSLSSSSSFSDEEVISILGIMEIIQATRYIIPCQHLSRSAGNIDIYLNIYRRNRPKEFGKFA